MQIDIFDVLEPSNPKPLNNILNVMISTPIALGEYRRERITFKTVEDKEEYLSISDVFSRKVIKTQELEIIVLNVDLWK